MTIFTNLIHISTSHSEHDHNKSPPHHTTDCNSVHLTLINPRLITHPLYALPIYILLSHLPINSVYNRYPTLSPNSHCVSANDPPHVIAKTLHKSSLQISFYYYSYPFISLIHPSYHHIPITPKSTSSTPSHCIMSQGISLHNSLDTPLLIKLKTDRISISLSFPNYYSFKLIIHKI